MDKTKRQRFFDWCNETKGRFTEGLIIAFLIGVGVYFLIKLLQFITFVAKAFFI